MSDEAVGVLFLARSFGGYFSFDWVVGAQRDSCGVAMGRKNEVQSVFCGHCCWDWCFGGPVYRPLFLLLSLWWLQWGLSFTSFC